MLQPDTIHKIVPSIKDMFNAAFPEAKTILENTTIEAIPIYEWYYRINELNRQYGKPKIDEDEVYSFYGESFALNGNFHIAVLASRISNKSEAHFVLWHELAHLLTSQVEYLDFDLESILAKRQLSIDSDDATLLMGYRLWSEFIAQAIAFDLCMKNGISLKNSAKREMMAHLVAALYLQGFEYQLGLFLGQLMMDVRAAEYRDTYIADVLNKEAVNHRISEIVQVLFNILEEQMECVPYWQCSVSVIRELGEFCRYFLDDL